MAASITLSNSLTLSPLLRSPSPPLPSQLTFPPSSTSPLSIKFQNPFSPVNSKPSTSSLLTVCSNTLLCKANSKYCNVEVICEEDEDVESLITRFRREVAMERVIPEIKRRRYFETSLEKRKRKSMEAARRYGGGSRRRLLARRQMEEKLKQEKEAEELKDAADGDEYENENENWDEDVAEYVPYCRSGNQASE